MLRAPFRMRRANWKRRKYEIKFYVFLFETVK